MAREMRIPLSEADFCDLVEGRIVCKVFGPSAHDVETHVHLALADIGFVNMVRAVQIAIHNKEVRSSGISCTTLGE